MEPYQKPFESQDKLHPLVTHHLPSFILFPYILTSLSNTTVLLETRAVYPLINCVFLGNLPYDRAVMILGVCILLMLKEKERERLCGGYTPLGSIKTLSFATITNVIGSAVN